MRLAALLLLSALGCLAQDFSQRGFFETWFIGYPQAAPPADSSHAVAEGLFRYEAFYRPNSAWRFSAGIDARTDSHRQDQRALHVCWWDRETRRPAFAVRRLSALYNHGPLTIELGKQFVRWGKADILNPTDRFAPRDFLTAVDYDFLAITAARVTYEHGGDTLDAIWAPRFTPSRIPLLNQRWAAMPAGVRLIDGGVRYPGGSQAGLRWNHVGTGYEVSLSFYDGFNTLPQFQSTFAPMPAPAVTLSRYYPRLRMYGADAAVPLRVFTLKGEAAYFGGYALYVVQAERPVGEWMFVGGYAGQASRTGAALPQFEPDRGLTRAFLGRATYTIDTGRSLMFEAALRQNGEGVWLKSEYSQTFGPHWRATAGFTLIRGARNDFLGQYRNNSHAVLALRYSF
jgi:hypothetical protein